MSGFRSWARGSACLVFSFCACGPEALSVDYGCDDVNAGDLVVTEVHANPVGRDGDREYIELFNTRPDSVSLLGITVTASRADGVSPKAHRLLDGAVGAGDYFVLGNAESEAMPEHIDYSYGDALGSLRNTEGSVSISCGDRLLDRVSYARTKDGRAQELDGALAPDHEVNDDPAAWCSTPKGVSALSDGSLGTPGRRNSSCGTTPLEGTCVEGESARVVMAPRAEDVRITEWIANPDGLDADFEWVEVAFGAEADLNGLQLGPSIDELQVVVDGDACFPVDAGVRLVFGASPAAAPRVDAELGFSLGNSGSRSVVAAIGGTVLDMVSYEGTTQGASWQIDEDGNICLAGESNRYDSANFGTPGERNPPCPPVLDEGMCLDEGVPRRIVTPAIGQAQISEWMADPAAVDNRAGEWVEIRFDASVDLNGLSLTDLSDSATTVQSDHCLSVPAGAHVVWARALDPSINGGIDAASTQLTLSLNNRDETLTLSVGGEVLDSVTYAHSERGAATQVDLLGNVCTASARYGAGDMGTPGSTNTRCF
jgi:hypothetical protein